MSASSNNPFSNPENHILYKLPQVCIEAKKSPASIYRGVKDQTFPAPVRIGKRSVAWTAASISAWKQSCIEASKFDQE